MHLLPAMTLKTMTEVNESSPTLASEKHAAKINTNGAENSLVASSIDLMHEKPKRKNTLLHADCTDFFVEEITHEK